MKRLYVLALIVVLVFSFSSMSFATQADDFDSYVDFNSVQHRTYWNEKNKISNKFWRFAIGIVESVTPDNVTGPGSFDEIISKIESVTISFETAANNCDDWSSPSIVAGPKTYIASQLEKMAFLNYSVGICPSYNSYLGQWYNPALDGNFCFANYEIMLNISKKDFSITSAACGRWVVVFNFLDGSSSKMEDYWDRWDDGTAQMVPYVEIDYTEEPLPVSNSSIFNVDAKSLRCSTLPDKETLGKKNLVIKWSPVNPLFNNNPDDPDFWPGLILKLGVVWEDKSLGSLPSSGFRHSIWKAIWASMPAHLDHYCLPWNYVEYIKQNSSLKGKGFKIYFQVRTNEGAKIRQVTTTKKVIKIRSKYKKSKCK